MLEAKNIFKTFNPGTVNANTALRGATLTLEDGDFVTVIGGNGAGKSTLLNAIAGVFPIDAGSVAIDGDDVTALPEHMRAKWLGRVFQDPMMGTASKMLIYENMSLAARRGAKRGLKWAFPKDEIASYKELLAPLGLGLEERLNTKVGLLSGGQRQALTLIMATMIRPKLLLLDEHTAALDPKTAEKVLEITDKLIAENNLTTMMITHNLRDAIRHGNRLVMMDSGRIILDIRGDEKQKLTVDALLARFSSAGGEELPSDSMILS